MASGSVDNICIFNILHDILRIIWSTVRWWGKKWTTISTRWNFAGVNCPKLKTYRTGAESDQSPRTDECPNGNRWVESVFSACKIRGPDGFWMAKQAGARFPDGLGRGAGARWAGVPQAVRPAQAPYGHAFWHNAAERSSSRATGAILLFWQ